jgi:hypothetical protein
MPNLGVQNQWNSQNLALGWNPFCLLLDLGFATHACKQSKKKWSVKLFKLKHLYNLFPREYINRSLNKHVYSCMPNGHLNRNQPVTWVPHYRDRSGPHINYYYYYFHLVFREVGYIYIDFSKKKFRSHRTPPHTPLRIA